MFIPKDGTKEYRKLVKLMKKSATKQKMEWLYVNKISLTLLVFVVTIVLLIALHNLQVHYILTEPTTDYDIVGTMTEKDKKSAMQLTEMDNKVINMFKNNYKVTIEDVKKGMHETGEFESFNDEKFDLAAERILGKIKDVNGEYLSVFEVLIGLALGMVGYMAPNFMLMFQAKMRELEMEDEVMQYQTIILMLMKIERVNIEMILEWLERYSNIFREPISRCVNNYESGPWEALEQLKEEIEYKDLIRIVESMQAAVEKIPIAEAFDELDSERDYYQAKRKETNDRLIARKERIGKAIGFAPMVTLFVGYLIIPLCLIGLTSMTSSFATMSSVSV
jgi:hypothetical protein